MRDRIKRIAESWFDSPECEYVGQCVDLQEEICPDCYVEREAEKERAFDEACAMGCV